ncbi:MAG: WYL domain-containing protein [Bacteroidales bacterium]|nr:WYL domain-containing protein [Bacteroidales bacterium]
MSKNLLNKYVWLVETIYNAKYITLEEINRRWLEEDMSEGVALPRRTFNTWRNEAEEIFGVSIQCDRKGGYNYYIENADDIKKGGLRNWLLDTISVSNLIAENKQLKDRILLEYVPSGREHLQTIIEALKGNNIINITYHSYWRDEESNFDVKPYCIKIFKQRWYLVALGTNHYYEKLGPWTYGLDRIKKVIKKEETFEMPEDWDAEEFFSGCFGIIADPKVEKQHIELKVAAGQANYIRDLHMHESQKEIERNDDYSIFTYYLRPTYDFIQELLRNGADMEVIEPQSLRDEVSNIVQRVNNYYTKHTK